MIKIVNEVMSKETRIPTNIIFQLLEDNNIVESIISEFELEDNSGKYLQASVDLAFAINLCNGKSAIANPVLETIISEDGERISPRNNLMIKIGTKYYNFSTKKFGIIPAVSNAITSYNEDIFDEYLIPNQEYKLTPTYTSYIIRDKITDSYIKLLNNIK